MAKLNKDVYDKIEDIDNIIEALEIIQGMQAKQTPANFNQLHFDQLNCAAVILAKIAVEKFELAQEIIMNNFNLKRRN